MGELFPWHAAAGLWALGVAYSDISRRRIPNVLTFGAALTGLAGLALTGTAPLGASGWSILAGVALALVFTLPGYALRQLGAGDVKLLVSIALLGGAAVTLLTFVVGALVAGALAMVWMIIGKRFGLAPLAGRRMPFGAILAFGFMAMVIGGATDKLLWPGLPW